MAAYDNPAKRLYALLSAYRDLANVNNSIRVTWAAVFECDLTDVALRLAETAYLVGDLTREVHAAGDTFQIDAVAHFGPKWAAPLVLPSFNPDQTQSPGKSLIDADALVALGGVASYLAAARPHVILPDTDAVAKARSHISEALELLAATDELPSDVRQVLIDRLHEVLWTLDRVGFLGAEPVTAAMERFAGAVLVNAPTTGRSKTINKAMAIVFAAWAVFMSGPRIDNAIEAWKHIAAITAGTDEPTVVVTPTPTP